ncbi:unnamed protein product [Blepharisma stoltei]|uniref:Uncharacterized protein n=1 Tax=Blepharisma stoltei TaxID=1481888 RepID=A0AAU9ISV7_9CILI|nr:unnamed protein product [Blepharisma stoltei]
MQAFINRQIHLCLIILQNSHQFLRNDTGFIFKSSVFNASLPTIISIWIFSKSFKLLCLECPCSYWINLWDVYKGVIFNFRKRRNACWITADCRKMDIYQNFKIFSTSLAIRLGIVTLNS